MAQELVKSDPSSNEETRPTGTVVINESSISIGGVSSLNTSEVTFKPNLRSHTYQKSLTPENREETMEESGPYEIEDTGMSQASQSLYNNTGAHEKYKKRRGSMWAKKKNPKKYVKVTQHAA